nr:hypothetical protein [Bacteroidota bacterium]
MENQKTDIDNSEKDNNPKRVVSGVNKKKRRVKRSVYWISALLFIFLVVIPLVVNFFADRIFGETMREIVRIESNGKYDFTYSKISFNLFKRKLRVLDFVLLPEKQSAGDTITMFPSDNEFDFKIPEFYIHGAGILSAITRGELIVGKIFFNEPHLHLNSTRIEPEDEKEPQKVQFSHHTVYPHIEGYLSLLRVDDFEIKNGTVSFHQVLDDSSEMVEINNISINVSGFHLDSIAHQNLERFFFSDSLSINFSGSDFMLEKNNHAISFRELNISSKNKTFEIGNFSVKFMDSANSAELKSWVDIDVPKLKFTGIDLNKSLQRNLYLDKIICQSPSVVYHAFPCLLYTYPCYR